jgi:ATP-dependent Clp protease ATP-binding subunit ClpA
MFERFTERARMVMVSAQVEAQRLQHNYLGTEHLLLGLLREEEGIAGQVLYSADIILDEVREQVEGIVGYGEKGTGGQSPFTPRSKRVLELALNEAMQLGHDYIGTEHLLLGLLQESEGVAARTLSNLDVGPDAVRGEVLLRVQDGGSGADMTYEAERGTEEGKHQTLYRGRVTGIRATSTSLRALSVDVDYSYWPPGDPTITRVAIEPEDIASVTRNHLDEMRVETLEGAVEASGTHLIETFLDVLEVTVSVTSEPGSAGSESPTYAVSATFYR